MIRIHQFINKQRTKTENMQRQTNKKYESEEEEKKRKLNRIDLCMSGQRRVEHQQANQINRSKMYNT